MIALACIILVGFGFGVGCIAIRLYDRSRKPDGLPCPHPMCRNLLPRRGLWNGQGYVVEHCPVCGGSILFNPHIGKGHDLHEKDDYIRFDRPELKP